MDNTELKLRAVGFCGVDDSVNPRLLALLSQAYPRIEWGVLFRPDRQGQPRYATADWVERLCSFRRSMNLAAHLCERRVQEVLNGQSEFLQQLQDWGFERVQINATAVNGVDTSRLAESVTAFREVVTKFPQIEFILQKNDETKPLWQGMLDAGLPPNISMLVDESKGTGVMASAWPLAPSDYRIGYAGGIGPNNIRQVLRDVTTAARGNAVWIDMESSLRSNKNGMDVFDIDKCYEVIEAVCEYGIMEHPSYLT